MSIVIEVTMMSTMTTATTPPIMAVVPSEPGCGSEGVAEVTTLFLSPAVPAGSENQKY